MGKTGGVRGFVGLAAVAGVLVLGMAVVVARAQGASFYCNEIVPAGYFCGVHLNTPGYLANNNQAYVQHGDGLPVCERVTIRYQAPNVSYRCGASPTDSQCDLLSYSPTTEFSM